MTIALVFVFVCTLIGGNTCRRTSQVAREKRKDLLPAIQRLFGPVGVAPRVKEGVPGAIVAIELVIFAKAFEHSLGPVHLIGGRIGVVVAENAQQRTIQVLGEID